MKWCLALSTFALALHASSATAQTGEARSTVKREQEPEKGKAVEDSTQDPEQDPDLFDEGLDELLGGDEDPAGGVSEAADSVLKGFKGFVQMRPRLYFRDRNAGHSKNNEQLIFHAELELDLEFGEGVSGYLRPRAYLDALDGALKRFEPLEAYLDFKCKAADLRFGQFVENWGIADTYNPIDVINRRDLGTDFLDPTRLGELGVRARLLLEGDDRIGEPTFSFYVLPVWRETLFAPEDQRFSFDAPGVVFDEDQGFEPDGFERVFLASRFQATLDTDPFNADVQFLMARGPERTPSVIPQGAFFVPAYFGAWTFGFGLRAVPNEDEAGEFLSTLTLKAEVAYKRPYTFDGSPIREPDDHVAYVLGIDRQFFDVLGDQDSLTVTAEYAGEEGANDFASTFRPFRNDVIGRLFWEVNDFERTSVEFRGIYDFDTHETIFEGIFERQLRFVDDDFKLIVQGQFFDPPGNNRSLFDFFPNNSSITVGFRLDF